MKLGSLKEGGRDGTLIVASRDLSRAVRARDIAPTLQAALDQWNACAPALEVLGRALEEGRLIEAFPLDVAALAAPLPRAHQWLDGSAYLSHVELVRKARGAPMPESLLSDPLMYQGCSAPFLAPTEPIALEDEAWGADFEAEVAVITDDVPMGASREQAAGHIRLLVLVNDVSLRDLAPGELAKGFGFLQSKPASALSPLAATPDELNGAWDGAKLHLPLEVSLNGALYGAPDAGQDMHFDFPTLIAHAARTRRLCAGTVLGAGTVSNRDRSKGSCCLVERRMIETLEHGRPSTPFLRFGDRVRIEMRDETGQSVFGAIEQEVVPYRPARPVKEDPP